ncbi:hypothetical protein SBRCBS47491_007799 [Sporothrix bragantina]|uniref:J domain-containing protein n=1 Tax=Sporothrix bragantina TaxID=671064 RepID=A0ABP0CGF9_9PEZI
MVVETALYERLGVTHDASDDQIRRSYRQAALLWHPDRNRDNPEAAEKFKACLEAYEILSNPDQRLLYDTYGLSGVQRTAEAPQTAQQTQPTQSRARRQRRPAPSFFDDDDDDFFSSFPTHSHTQTQTQRSSGGGGQPRGFSFSTSWTFSTSASNGTGGSYTTHYQSWNSRDGHQSRRSSGTFGNGGNQTISNNGNSNRSRSSRHSNTDQQQQQQTATRSDSTRRRAAREAAAREEAISHPAQNMQSMFNMFQSGGGLFGPSGHMDGGGFGGIFSNMANDFSVLFANRLFGEPHTNQNNSSNGRQQSYRQYRER